MGKVQKQNAHFHQSSKELKGSPFQNNRMRIIIGTGIATLTVAMGILLWHAATMKQITVVTDGVEEQVETRANLVADVLEELELEIGPHDEVSMALDAELQDGDRLEIKHAIPVYIQADGEVQKIYTTAKTVEEVLEWNDFVLGELDKVEPTLESNVAEEEVIRIVRVETVIEEMEETIPFETVTKQDNTLLKGKQQTIQEGKDGLLLKRYEKVLEDGVVVTEKLIGEEVVDPGQQQVIAIGTKNEVTVLSASSPTVQEVTMDGVTFGAKKVLNNVTMTAYTAGPRSTGKTEDHPGYGITYTGTEVTEGRTIAVDPDVIPLGWWVYIEGIGFRRAEDIGSAIKGNRIDIYFDSEEYALKFGKKSGYTVYIIGPEKTGNAIPGLITTRTGASRFFFCKKEKGSILIIRLEDATLL